MSLPIELNWKFKEKKIREIEMEFFFIAIIFVVLFVAGTLAAQNNESKDVEVMEAGVNRRLPVPNRQRREQKINFPDEEDLDTPLSQRPPRYTKDGYAINYSENLNIVEFQIDIFISHLGIPKRPGLYFKKLLL